MADEGKFTEGGVKLYASVTGTIIEVSIAGGPAGVTVGLVVGAIVFVVEVIEWLSDDTTVAQALESLQKHIENMRFLLGVLDQRLDQLVPEIADESNRQTLRDLMDYADEIGNKARELQSQTLDVGALIKITNECGVLLDKFLRSDFDIWRWTDVVERTFVSPETGQQTTEPALATLRFKYLPTLPIYVLAMLTWLGARERVVQLAGKAPPLDDDANRINRHLTAISVRPEFDKYHAGDDGKPTTIAENIKWNIRGLVNAYTKYPEDRECRFYFDVQNWMSGDRKKGDDFSVITVADNVLCSVDPNSLGTPSLELDMETACGVEVLNTLAGVLQRVANTGTLREQLIGKFPNTKAHPPAMLYVIAQDGDLHWYRNEDSSQPGGSTDWLGPRKVGNGWHGFTTVFSGGGAAIYGVQPDGTLLWYGHDGYLDGSPSWRDARQVGNGWNGFKSIFPGGEYVVYGIQPDGTLLWYKHDGAASGGDVTTWSGRVPVDSGWHSFAKVFAGGEGIIFTIGTDGVLIRHDHRGYATGTSDWGPQIAIGTGWNGFQEVVAGPDGVFYAFTRDGRVLWYRYQGERPSPVNPGGGAGGHDPHIWEGPVEIKRGVPGFKSVFPLMNPPFRGPA